jgi:hypothetical protein
LEPALKEAGVSSRSLTSGGSSYSAQERARLAKRKAHKSAAMAVTPSILEKLKTSRPNLAPGVLPLLAMAIFKAAGIDALAFVAKRRRLCDSQNDAHHQLERWLKAGQTDSELLSFIIEIILCAEFAGSFYETTWSDGFKAVAQLVGVDLKSALKAASNKKGSK